MPSPLRAYVTLVFVAGTVVLVDAVGRLSADPPPADWWLLVFLTVMSGSAVLKIPKASVHFSISDVFTLTSAVVFGPAAGVAAVAVDCLAISYRLARTGIPAERVLFNAAAPPLAMWISAHLFFELSGPVAMPGGALERMAPALLLTAGVYFLLNTFAVAIAIALHDRRRVLAIWREQCGNLWLSYLGGALGAGVVVFAMHLGYGTVVLSIPLPLALILHFAYRNATGRVEDRLRHLEELNRLHLATVESLAHAIDAKDSITHNHIRRVQTCALVLAKQIGLDDEAQLKALEAAALLHDIGKIAVPEHILNKPGRLTPAEFERMKTHAAVGAEILAGVQFPYPVVPIVRHHHENWDGTGYPDGLRGGAIPIGARILSVIDCYDALTSDRPYRRALSPDAAFAIIRERRGLMYDPLVVDAFESIYPTLAVEAAIAEPHAVARAAQLHGAGAGAHGGGDRTAAVRVALELGAAVAATPFRDAGPVVWEYLRQVARVDAMALFEVMESRERLRVAYAAGAHAEVVRDTSIAVGARLSGWVAATGAPMINADPALDFDGAAPNLRSALVVPGGDRETVIVLALYSHAVDAFDDASAALAQAVVGMLARAARR